MKSDVQGISKHPGTKISKSESHKTVTPVNTGGLRQAAWRCRKSLPKDPQRRFDVVNEIIRLEKVSQRELQYSDSPKKITCRSLTKNLISMAKLGVAKKFDKVERVA